MTTKITLETLKTALRNDRALFNDLAEALQSTASWENGEDAEVVLEELIEEDDEGYEDDDLGEDDDVDD